MSRLTDPTEIEEAKADLKEAKAAYKSLMLGQAVASWKDQNGEELVYGKADLKRLETYIFNLRCALGQIDHSASAPLRPFFR